LLRYACLVFLFSPIAIAQNSLTQADLMKIAKSETLKYQSYAAKNIEIIDNNNVVVITPNGWSGEVKGISSGFCTNMHFEIDGDLPGGSVTIEVYRGNRGNYLGKDVCPGKKIRN
jgi:hypothetical protein